jgi:hypothetical protein
MENKNVQSQKITEESKTPKTVFAAIDNDKLTKVASKGKQTSRKSLNKNSPEITQRHRGELF